jgi:anthranilate phosphoribosyltransferase
VFEALGIRLDATPETIEKALTAGCAFFFAPIWHPSMRHAGPTRRELGVRTAFNLLGPLTNPAGARRQIVGVSRPEHTALLARALGALGAERAWVVHGAGGLDELSTLGHTKVSELKDGTVNTFYIHPFDVSLPQAALADLAGGTAAENAAVVERLLGGERGPRRDIVLLNAAAGLLIAGRVSSLQEGTLQAAESLDNGAAARVLADLRRITTS